MATIVAADLAKISAGGASAPNVWVISTTDDMAADATWFDEAGVLRLLAVGDLVIVVNDTGGTRELVFCVILTNDGTNITYDGHVAALT